MITSAELAEIVVSKIVRLAENWQYINVEGSDRYGTVDQKPWHGLFRLAKDPALESRAESTVRRMDDDYYVDLLKCVVALTGCEIQLIDRALVVLGDPVAASIGMLKGKISDEDLERWRIEDEEAELRRERLLDDIMRGKW